MLNYNSTKESFKFLMQIHLIYWSIYLCSVSIIASCIMFYGYDMVYTRLTIGIPCLDGLCGLQRLTDSMGVLCCDPELILLSRLQVSHLTTRCVHKTADLWPSPSPLLLLLNNVISNLLPTIVLGRLPVEGQAITMEVLSCYRPTWRWWFVCQQKYQTLLE